LPVLEHHTYSEDDVESIVEEGGIKIKKNITFFHENGNFFTFRVGKKVKKNLFLFQITTFGCRRVRQTRYKKIFT
jgi:hypothetical protein